MTIGEATSLMGRAAGPKTATVSLTTPVVREANPGQSPCSDAVSDQSAAGAPDFLTPIAALFVETDGVYYNLPGVEPWDVERDARRYAGPRPVVAHPPCARWCRFAKQVEKVHGHKVGDDGGTFYVALDAVKTYGGVLEHPAGSLAWDAYGLPKPRSSSGWTTSLLDGGSSCYVEQGRYGQPMRKATWLYAYGVDLPELRWGRTNDNEMLGEFKWGSRLYKPAHDRDRPRLRAGEHARTTTAFRDVLIAMARTARVAEEVA